MFSSAGRWRPFHLLIAACCLYSAPAGLTAAQPAQVTAPSLPELAAGRCGIAGAGGAERVAFRQSPQPPDPAAQPPAPVRALAAALVAAQSDAERDALLAAKKELVGQDLLLALADMTTQRFRQEDLLGTIAASRAYEAVAVRLGDRKRAAYALGLRGQSHLNLGELDAALACFRRSQEISEQAGDRLGVARAVGSIGVVLEAQGNYGAALQHIQQDLTICEAVSDRAGAARALNNIASVYDKQGDLDRAEEMLRRSIAIKEELGDEPGKLSGLVNLGFANYRRCDPAGALSCYEKALLQARALGSKGAEAHILGEMGHVYRMLGEPKRAIEFEEKALAEHQALHSAYGVCNTLLYISGAYLDLGQYEEAVDYATRAGEAAQQSGQTLVLLGARYWAGKAYRALNRPVESRAALEESISLTEQMRSRTGGGAAQRQQFFESRLGPYYELADLLVSEHRAGDALAWAERARARVLLDILHDGRIDVTKAMTPVERAREQKLHEELTAASDQLAHEQRRPQTPADRPDALRHRLEAARRDYDQFETELYVAHPDLRAQRGEAPLITAAGAAALLPNPATAALEFLVGDEHAILFALTRGSQPGSVDLRTYVLPVRGQDLRERVDRFREQLARRDPQFRGAARALYDLLLAPAEAQLNGKRALIIVPDGPLWELPFQALQTARKRYLLEQCAVSYAPSLTVLAEMERRRSRPAGPALFAVGNPAIGEQSEARVRALLRTGALGSLPEAQQEVRTLRALYGPSASRIYVGPEAREERVKKEAPAARTLHFATHALLNNASPMYSCIVLATPPPGAKEDGFLEAWEVMKLDLKADLAVLSACETARGRIGDGEGIIGLLWSFFVAGCPAVVASEWKVESTSTSRLMIEFHRQLQARRDGAASRLSKAEALRQAALKLLRTEEYRHPFYWAGFSAYGNPQ